MLEQADGTAWMAFYCAHDARPWRWNWRRTIPAYEDIASKFFEHFVAIADAMNTLGGNGLWNEDDGFYYDQLWSTAGHAAASRGRWSALSRSSPSRSSRTRRSSNCPGFTSACSGFSNNRQDLAGHITYMQTMHDGTAHGHRLLAIPSRERLERVLRYMLDENEFLSPYGIRCALGVYKDQPYIFQRRRRGAPGRVRARASRTPACSAATRTGAARSGSRSITC